MTPNVSKKPDAKDAWELYEDLVLFAVAHGLRREEPMSGWWAGPGFKAEMQLGEAITELLLEVHGIDTRTKVDGEPMEFWGGVSVT